MEPKTKDILGVWVGGLVMMGLLFGPMFLSGPYEAKVIAQRAALDGQLQPLLQAIRSTPPDVVLGKGPLQKPFVRLLCSLAPDDGPDLKDVALAPKWQEETLGNLGAQMEWDIITPLPSVSPKTIVLVASKWRQTGIRVPLDQGTAPEARHFVRIFAMTASERTIVWQSPLLIGGHAEKPSARSPGITFVSEVAGDEVPRSDIEKTIARIPWAADGQQ